MNIRNAHLALAFVAATAAGGRFAAAQPPEGRDGPPPEHRDALRDALDTDGDHQLDAAEIRNAATSLAKADRDGDGRIDHDEFRPPRPPMPPGEDGFRGPPPEGEGFRGPPGGPGGAREGGPGGRPPREGGLRRPGGPGSEAGPSPERFVERALSFDRDGDGKLDRTELEKFAGEMLQRRRAGGEGGPPGRGGPPRDGERPQRPRRPE